MQILIYHQRYPFIRAIRFKMTFLFINQFPECGFFEEMADKASKCR